MARRIARHVALIMLAVVPAAGVGAASAAPATGNLTPAQVRTAVARMSHARGLWATVNVCNTHRQPGVIGVRAQMPALGFMSRMSLLIAVQYRDAVGRWRPVVGPEARYGTDLGRVSAGDEQAGSGFAFTGYHGTLRGAVTFTWRRSGHVLLRLTRTTTSGHRDADGGDPARYSAANCTLP